MKLYDENIRKLQEMIGSCYYIDPDDVISLPVTDREELILKSDMQVELGGGGCYAVSGMAFTTSCELVPNDGIFEIRMCGEESLKKTSQRFSDCQKGSSLNYARFTLIRLNKEADDKKTQELYTLLRRIDYLRYHIYLKGVAMRITSAAHREVLRISTEASDKGISAEQIMKTFLGLYKSMNLVEAVQIYYVVSEQEKSAEQETSAKQTQSAEQPEFWNTIEKQALSCEAITESLNVIFKGLNMDCSTCGQKAVCDTVEGMRELHEGLQE